MKDFREPQVWRKAHELVLTLYSVTRKFPKDKLYGLTSQIRRCAVSVAEYHLLLARDLRLLPESEYKRLNDHTVEVRRMRNALTRRVDLDRELAKR